MSWKSFDRWLALTSANCDPAGTGTPLKGARQISILLSVALVSQPGTADSSRDAQLLAAMTGVSNDPFSIATLLHAVGACNAIDGGTGTPMSARALALTSVAEMRARRSFG